MISDGTKSAFGHLRGRGRVMPACTFDDAPLDLICIPGGSEVAAVIAVRDSRAWLKEAGHPSYRSQACAIVVARQGGHHVN
jgi:hypothetical protein